ncbi:hypothetical protein [Rhizobium leguminosarum]
MALPPFTNGFRPFLQNNSDTLLAAGAGLLGGATAPQQVAGLAQGVAGARQKNKTLEFLRQQNPELAAAVESGALSGGDAYKLFYQQKLEAQKPKNNYLTAGKNIYDLDTKQWISPPGGADGGEQEYGLNPQYGVDAQGNPVILQLSKGGTSHQTALPPGVSLSKEPIKLDAGTEWVILDPITRQPVGRIPKNVAEAASQKEIGEAQGKAVAAAPGDLQAAQNALDMVESIRNDPNKGRGTGFSSVLNSIPGTGGYDFSNKVDQAKSGAFLTAIQQMRGLGSLSNAEGGAATAAVNRMNTATSEPEFNAALDDYEKIVRQGAARAQQRLQQGGGQVQAPPGIAPPGATSSGVKWSIEP